MKTVNIREAKTQISRLIAQAAGGEPFIIAKIGKPLVKVTRLATPDEPQIRRLGFMKGRIAVPKDFDRMGPVRDDFQIDVRALRLGLLENGYEELVVSSLHAATGFAADFA